MMEDSQRTLLFIGTAVFLVLPYLTFAEDNPIKMDKDPIWYNPCTIVKDLKRSPPLDVDRQQEQELFTNLLEKIQDVVLYMDGVKDKMTNELFQEKFDQHLQSWSNNHPGLLGTFPEFNLTADSIQQDSIPDLDSHSDQIIRSLRVLLQRVAVFMENITFDAHNSGDPKASVFYSMFEKLNQVLCEIDRVMFSLNIGKEPDAERSSYPDSKRDENRSNSNDHAFMALLHYTKGFTYANKAVEYLNRVSQYYAQAQTE